MLPVPWFALHQCRFHGIGRLGLSEHEVPCRIKARTERAGNQIGRRARQTNVLCYRSILNVQARSKHEPFTGPTNPTSIRPRRAVAENHQGGSNFRFSTNEL